MHRARRSAVAGAIAPLLALSLAPAPAPGGDAPAPRRLPRAESFLGIHFDFHANKDCTEVGKNTTPAMVDRIIDLVGPDYLQIDCKGHPGYSSYPTAVGNRAPGIVGDPLRVWRDATARRGVALYMHYSGVWDSRAIELHPDWAAVGPDGKPGTRATSRLSPYADRLLIPQLRELAGVYGVDGAWIDGDCWASVPDYGDAALRAFREATGLADAPRKAGEEGWFEFLQFHRELFRKHLRHVIAEVKREHPAFQICSNWAFTDHMPEPVCAPVDFLSGDYSPQDSVNSARLAARYLARQGKPWDLMAWSFSTKPARAQKSAVQLQREAALVLAMGGGFQAYFTQRRDGSVQEEQMPVMGEVARFCRARQALCHRAEPVPQIALLLSTWAHYRSINGLFPRDPGRFTGILHALLECGRPVELLGEHHLAGRLALYPLVIVPEWETIDPVFRDALAHYVRDGGNLLLIGPRASALFAAELGLAPASAQSPAGPIHLAHAGAIATLKGEARRVLPGPGAREFGRLHESADPASPSSPAATIVGLGRGRIAAAHLAFSRGYLAAPSAVARRFLDDLVAQLLPDPLVEVKGGNGGVDVCPARKDGRLLIHLVNTSGPHATRSILESIEPVGPFTVRVRRATRPTRVALEPSGAALSFTHADGALEIEVPRVAIHEAVVIEPE